MDLAGVASGREDAAMAASVEAGAAVTDQRLGYRPGLDGLRAAAVALVVADHFLGSIWTYAGDVGVTMFLTLSGFLITKLLLEEQDRTGGVSRCGFYRRRVARLAPALPLVLVACALVNASHGLPVAGPLLASLFYVQNIRVGFGHYGDAFDHLWSLALEEQFYLLWPLVVGAVSRDRLLKIALWSVPACLVARVAMTGVIHEAGYTRVDGLLVGCGLAVWVHRYGAPRPPGWVVTVACAVVAAQAVSEGSLGLAFGYTLVELSAVVLVCAALYGTDLPAPVIGLGKISYGVYLWHVPLMWVLLATYGPVVTLIVTLWVSVVSYRFVEVPARRRLLHALRRDDAVGELR